MLDGKKTFSDLADEKKKYFEDAEKNLKKPITWKDGLKNLASSALSTLGNSLFTGVISLIGEKAISLAFEGINYLIHKDDIAIEKGQEAKETIAQQTEEYQNQKKTLGDLTASYERLSKGVRITGNSIKNINLSDSDYQEFLETTNSIADIAPFLVQSWDSEGNAILKAGTNVSDLNKQVSDYLTLQRNLVHYNTKENIQTQYEGIVSQSKLNQEEIDDYQKQIDKTQEKITSLEDAQEALKSQNGIQTLFLDTDSGEALIKELDGIDGYIGSWEENGKVEISIDTDKIDVKKLQDISGILQGFKEQEERINEEAKINLQSVQSLDKQNWSNILPSIQTLATTSSLFDEWDDQELASEFQSKISSIFSNLDYETVSNALKKSGKNVYDWTMEDIINPLANATEDQQKIWQQLFEFEPKENESISAVAQRRDAILEQIAAFSENDFWTKGTLAKAFGFAYTGEDGKTTWYNQEQLDLMEKAMSDATDVREWMKGLNTEDFNLVIKIRTSGDKEALTNLDTLKAALEESKIAAEKASEKEKYSLSNMQANVSSAQTALSSFSSVLTETTSAGGVSADNIKILNDAFSDLEDVDLTSLFVNTSDGVKLNIDSLKQLTEQQNKIKSSDFAKAIQLQNEAMKEQLDISKDLSKPVDERQAAVDEYDRLKEEMNTLLQARSQYQAIAKQQQALFSDYSTWQRATQTENAGDKYLSMVSGLKNAKDAYDNGLIGTDDFKTFAAMISPSGSDDAENFAENYAKASRYLTEDFSGINNFIKDLDSKGLADFNDETKEWTFNIENMAKAAQKMGVGKEFMTAMFDRMEDYGFHNNFVSSIDEGIGKVNELSLALVKEKKHLEELKKTDPTNTSAINASSNKIKQYQKDIEQVTQNMTTVSEDSIADAQANYEAASLGIKTLDEQRKKILSSDLSSTEKQSIWNQITDQMDQLATDAGTTIDAILKDTDNKFKEQIEKQKQYSKDLANASVDNVVRPDFGEDTESAENYESALGKVQEAWANNDQTLQDAVTTLSQYNSEQLKGINLSDGAYDNESLIEAEKALDTICQTLGLSAEEGQQLATVLESIGLIKPDASTEIDSLLGLQQSNEISPDIELDFSSAEMTTDELKSKIEELNGLKAEINPEVNPEASQELDNLIAKTQEEYDFRIGIEATGKTPEELLALGKDEQIQAMAEVGVTVDDSNYESFISTVQSQTIDAKIQTKLTEGTSVEELLGMDDNELSETLEIDTSQVESAREELESLQDAASKATVTVRLADEQFNQIIAPEEKTVNVIAEPEELEVSVKDATVKVTPDPNPVPIDVIAKGPVTVPDATGIANYNLGESPEGVPDASGSANFTLGEHPEFAPDISGIANYTGDFSNVGTAPTLHGTIEYTKVITGGGISGGGGRSWATGTLTPGNAYNVVNLRPAFANGKVALDRDEEAVVNELGTEGIIRNGRLFAIPGGMHMQSLKKGDIILSTKQMKALFSGKDAGTARAYAGGTGTNSQGISSFKIPTNIASTSNTKATKQNTASVKANTEAQDKNTEAANNAADSLNWVEKRIKYLSDKTKKIADSITDYVSSAFKEKQLSKQISSIDNEILGNQKAYEVYKNKADSINLDESYKKLVQKGDYKIEDLAESNSELSKTISQYENWHIKAEECKNTISELKQTQLDLFKDLMNAPLEEASKKIDKLTASYQGLEAVQSRLNVGQTGESAINQMKNIMSEGVNKAKSSVDKAEAKLQSTVDEQTIAYKSYSKTANALLNSKVITKKQKKAIQKAIKNNQEIDAKSLGLTGKNITRAKALNKKLNDKKAVDQKVNDAIYQRDLEKIAYISMKDNADYALSGGDGYEYANHLVDLQLENQKQQSKIKSDAFLKINKKKTTQASITESANKQVASSGKRIAKYYSKKKLLTEKQIKALNSGKEVSTKGVTNSKLLEKLKTYNEYVKVATEETTKLKIAEEAWNTAGQEAAQAQAELAQANIEAVKTKFENIQSYYEATLDYQKSIEEGYNNARSKRDAEGYDLTEADYAGELNSLTEQKSTLEQEKASLIEQLNTSIADGTIKEGSKEWYEFQTQINSVGSSIDNVDLSMIDLQNTVNTLNLTRLENMNSLLSSMLGNLKNVLSLTTAAGKYNTSAEYQDVINTTNDQYGNYSQQADIDRENWNKAIANGGAYAGKSADEWQAAMYDNLANAKQALAEIYNYQKEQRELPLNRLNDELSNLKSLLDVISSESDLKEAQGHYLDTLDYQKQIAATNNQIAKQEAINRQNQLLYQDALSRGAEADAAQYYDAWQSGISSLNNMKSSVEELSDKIRDDFVESVKRAIDAIGDIRDVVESEIKVKQAEGKYLTASDYEKQIRLNTQEYENQQQIISDRYQKYNEALIAGNEAEADQMLSEAREAEAAANNLLASNAELQKSIQNLFRDTIQRELDALDSAQSVLESEISLIKAQDRDLTNENYTSQIDMNMEMIKKQEALARENQRLYELEVSKGNMQAAAEYLQAWKSAEAEVNNLRADIESLGDEMRTAFLTKDIDDFLDSLEQLRSSISTISELINEDMMYDDNGHLTNFGITALAMNIKEYESDTESLKALLEKRQKYIEEYNNGMNEYYSKNEFDEDMKNVTADIQEMLNNAASAREAIVEMVTKTSKMEIEALNDVIDKRVELLQAQKDAYSFDKSLKSQTNDLTLLQKQKEALEGLTDKESQAKLQKLNKQIKDAQEELDATITDHSFDLRIDGLEDLKEDISDAYDNYVKQLNSNLEAITDSVTNATDIVTGALGSVEEAITKILDSYGVSGLDKDSIGYTKQYANGTNFHPGGPAIVNDGNGLEMVVLPDGRVLFPTLPTGSGVINADQTRKFLDVVTKGSMPQVQIPKFDTSNISSKSSGNTSININGISFNINDAINPNNVMQVIHKNIKTIASDVGTQFSKNISKTGTKKTWS